MQIVRLTVGLAIAKRALTDALGQALGIGRLTCVVQGKKGIGVSPNECDLEAAFKLIRHFKEGRCAAASQISARDIELLQLLKIELLPSENDLKDDLERLVLRIAEEDSRWNRRVMETIYAIYSLRSIGKKTEADSLRLEFLRACPSTWYKRIVEAV